MRLTSITYAQWEGTPREWKIEGVQLGPINLLVGSNASGKSRTLNVISGLAKLFSGATKVSLLSGDYDVSFADESTQLHYKLNILDSKVTHESFAAGTTTYLERGAGGAGRI
jgi:energy-coupling factor transporter ATP-binding protein EcfA2